MELRSKHSLTAEIFVTSLLPVKQWLTLSFKFPNELQTSISVFEGQAHFNNLYTELIIEVTYAEHLGPKTFASCEKNEEREVKKLTLKHVI